MLHRHADCLSSRGTVYISLRNFSLAIAMVLCAASASAVTLSWDAQTWTNGSLTNSYDVDPANVGNDVTVSVSGNTPQLGIEQTGQQTPALTTNLQGGLAAAHNTLTLLVDFTSNTQSVTVTVNFSSGYTQGVSNVSFSVFDVDFANTTGANAAHFQDELRSIVGIAPDGTQIAPTITVGPNVLLTGTGLNQAADGTATTVDTGTGSGDANVTISFSSPVKSFSFVYGSGSNTPADPTSQHIGIYDLSFTPVPEINPSIAAAVSCLLAAFLIRRHNARFRK